MEALAWYKGASERGAEHLSLLSKDLPVGGWLDFGEDVSPLPQEPLVPKALIPPMGSGSACSAPCLAAKQGGSQGCSSRRAPTWLRLDPSPPTGNETLVQPTKCTNI